MTDVTPASADEWIEVGDAASMLGYDADTILRLVRDESWPSIGIAGKRRTARRIPRALVTEARQRVFAGGQVELREFARQWSARNAAPEAVA
jgi:hypothetical protein